MFLVSHFQFQFGSKTVCAKWFGSLTKHNSLVTLTLVRFTVFLNSPSFEGRETHAHTMNRELAHNIVGMEYIVGNILLQHNRMPMLEGFRTLWAHGDWQTLKYLFQETCNFFVLLGLQETGSL